MADRNQAQTPADPEGTGQAPITKKGRLLSLDVYRGITMFLLIASGAGLYNAFSAVAPDGSILEMFARQFHHVEWEGLRFWDLVQPFFMFIVGVAMPFSFGKRWARGDSWYQTLAHAAYRSILLLALGIGVYCVTSGELVFELWNVLAQLSFTYFVAFLLMRKSTWTQISVSLGLILATELAFRLFPMEGFNQPFTPDKNFGSYVDLLIMGKLSDGHWLAINAVPTTAHTMWGVLAGYVLKSDRSDWDKTKIIAIAGLIGLVVGYGVSPITPIIKRICTSSFVIVSGGYCLLALAASYWIFDVKNYRPGARFFAVVGMNPLFIYLFDLLGGSDWFEEIVSPFTQGFFWWLGENGVALLTAGIVLWMMWYMCHWLYERSIFIKI